MRVFLRSCTTVVLCGRHCGANSVKGMETEPEPESPMKAATSSSGTSIGINRHDSPTPSAQLETRSDRDHQIADRWRPEFGDPHLQLFLVPMPST